MTRFILIAATASLAACSPEFQTSSGGSYLAATSIADPKVAAAARYEPNLSFPARIGVVRMVYGQIRAIPEAELALYAEGLPPGLGNFVQLGALEDRLLGHRRGHSPQERIRALAASRHLDYVLVLSLNPSTNAAEALFLDVANGYPYASVEAKAPGSGRRNFWGGRLRNQSRLDRATLELAREIKPQLSAMATGLLARSGPPRR